MKLSNPRRQFLKNTLLGSVAVGISPMISGRKTEEDIFDCNRTTLDFYGPGPFYTENPPLINNQLLADENEEGVRLVLSGRVLNLDCQEYIPNTRIDIWHANHAGDYDNIGYNLRGYTESNDQGFYLFETIVPGKYLNGTTFRPSHIHFKITTPGFDELITQLYFEGDEEIPGDAAASIMSGEYDASHRIIPLTENVDGKMEGTWDIVLQGNGISTNVQDLHLNKGMIYTTRPNPFDQELIIQYGVFKKAKVGLHVFDLQGRQVAILEERVLSAEKYEASWKPGNDLSKGYYFVALKVNDLQVHYLKVQKI